MSVLNSATYEEMLELVKRPSYPVRWKYSCVVITDGVRNDVINLNIYQVKNDFVNEYYGYHFLTVTVDAVVHRRMLNNLTSLQVELTQTQDETASVPQTGKVKSQLFNAKLTDPTNPELMSIQKGGSRDDQQSQLLGHAEITLQLIEPFMSDYRVMEIGGVVRDETVQDVLTVLLGRGLPKVASADLLSDPSYMGLRGVHVVKPDNTIVHKQLILETGTRLIDLPRLLQDTVGVYTSGLGWHVHRGRCYVFPKLRYDLFQEDTRTLTILNVPEAEIPTMEKTFLVRSGQLFVFSTGETGHADLSEEAIANVGNGLRFIKSTDLVNGYHVNTENKTSFTRTDYVREYLIDERAQGDNNVKSAKPFFTDNPFNELSEMTEGLGSRLRVNWDHAEPNLLYPGMQVRYMYVHNDEVIQMYGSLIGLHTFAAPTTDRVLDNQYTTSCSLTIHVKRKA